MGKIDKVRGKSDKYEARSSVEIGLLLYPGVQSAAVDGLTDLFVTANRLSTEREGPRAPQLRVTHWKLNNKTERLEVVFDTHGRDRESLGALILPPSLDFRALWGANAVSCAMDRGTARQRHRGVLDLCRSLSTGANRFVEWPIRDDSLDTCRKAA